MFIIDPFSQTLTVDADYSFKEIEQELAKGSYTLGYHPGKLALTLREALSAATPNLYALKYGELQDLCVALEWESRAGIFLHTLKVPRQATGANWKNIVLGSQEELGLIYRATLKLFLKENQSLFFIVTIPEGENSYALEQDLRRHELEPLLFGRFSKNDLKKFYGSLRGESFLVLEWEGNEKFFTRLRAEWNHRVAAHYTYQVIEGHELQKVFSKLLRNQNSEIPWGGRLARQSSEALVAFKSQLVKGWK